MCYLIILFTKVQQLFSNTPLQRVKHMHINSQNNHPNFYGLKLEFINEILKYFTLRNVSDVNGGPEDVHKTRKQVN